MAPLVSNPLTFIVFQRTLLTLLLSFTSPHSPLRLFLFPIPIAWNIYLLPHYKDHFLRSPWMAFAAGEAIGSTLNYIEKVLIKGYAASDKQKFGFTSKSETKQVEEQDSWTPNLRFGAWLAFSDRYIGSRYEVKSSPSWGNRNRIPSKRAFMLRKAWILGVCYLLVDFLTWIGKEEKDAARKKAVTFSTSQISFFSRVWNGYMTREELTVRVVTSVGFWAGAYVVVQFYFSLLSLLGVVMGVSEPRWERPILGHLRAACTLRGFWSGFWHSQVRARLVAIADWTLYSLLKVPLPPPPPHGKMERKEVRLFRRYTHLFLCFLVSGLYHQAIEMGQGLKWKESGATVFFLLIAVGIMIEDAVQWIWFDVLSTDPTAERRGKWWRAGVGYLWVIVWFSIATPWYAYPGLSRNTGGVEDTIVPFSVIEWLLES